MIPAFGPIQAPTGDAVPSRFQSADLDPELVCKPLCTRRRNQKALTFAGDEQHPLLQSRRDQHTRFTGKMVVASPGEAEWIVTLALRCRLWTRSSMAQRSESFEDAGDVLVGESVIPMPAFTDHSQKTARKQLCQVLARASGESPAAVASSVAGNARPSINAPSMATRPGLPINAAAAATCGSRIFKD